MKCPICESFKHELFDQDKKRKFYRCIDCDLVFVPREAILSASDEQTRYEAHQNSENDPYYIKYLTEIADSTIGHLTSKSRGLDFGCGRTNLLANIFLQRQFEVSSFDLYFHPNQSVLRDKYDFIILSEVIEHLADPLKVMTELNEILLDNGKFVIKTKFYPERPEEFSNWFYKRDLTHVEFFNEKSMKFLASKLKKTTKTIGTDLYLLT